MAQQSPVGKRLPPIPNTGPHKVLSLSSLPAVVFRRDLTVRPQKAPTDYLNLDLKTPRLNGIHQHLWLAGLPAVARPLHKQKQLGRSLLITEDPDEHLVWFETQILLKPLPLYLLDYTWWVKHLCESEDLYRSACGLLLSYAWLVGYPCDLDIAKDAGLLPHEICWHDWSSFIGTFLDSIDSDVLSNSNERYQYGELRLSRLNTIYRFILPAHSLRGFLRGYKSGSTWYSAYYGGYVRGLLVLFAMFSVTLSALQVGLATPNLQKNHSFGVASYGFTIATLIFIVISVAIAFLSWVFLFWYHLLSTWWNDRKKGRELHRDRG
ncbi:hypothetical protein BU24DRAFT_398901 [Aaosphaeria arxii CBS 175.79]|uniref:Uncharacterized protein n=1 Tax=Aaosphaeria arxii CBS 175.79 TaxID=1450172 RepID=A0A6A5XDI1_9PLEO|nr:uncharacterized protein BU24DRAFT_398901 [Aaosphaeria arxii CBS 175.79]KAF2010867.1 hypothetical protein BU24DRAFT_398901 [Aaosphaeria arxii CBS 175.79]